MAQVLLAQGVRWGDRVVAYLPETPTLAMLHLGCARIGAVPVAVPVSTPALLERVLRASRARVLVTADAAAGAGEPVPLWEHVEDVVGGLGRVEAVLVERRAGAEISLVYGRDHDLGVALLHGFDAVGYVHPVGFRLTDEGGPEVARREVHSPSIAGSAAAFQLGDLLAKPVAPLPASGMRS